ncbi:MAG: YitT family protein [Lachnospiraceae bacterium]|nr:YitT family protein [Lachnospiraceae bacterium]
MKKNRRDQFFSVFQLTAGSLLAAFALEEFLVPNNIFDGGVVGVSMILHNFLPVPLGLLTVIINIPFLIYAMLRIGKQFLGKAAYAMILFSILLEAFKTLPEITDDLLLATVFGGVLLGVGVGMVLRGGGCLDGTEIVGIFVNRKFSFSVGKTVLLINIVIYAIAGALFGLDKALYSVLMYFITSRIIDAVQTGMDQAKALQVITEEGEKIADAIYENFGRTVTFIRGEGLISGTKKDILYCVITRAEIYEFRKLIRSMDVSAFITVTDVSEIIGNHVKSPKH